MEATIAATLAASGLYCMYRDRANKRRRLNCGGAESTDEQPAQQDHDLPRSARSISYSLIKFPYPLKVVSEIIMPLMVVNFSALCRRDIVWLLHTKVLAAEDGANAVALYINNLYSLYASNPYQLPSGPDCMDMVTFKIFFSYQIYIFFRLGMLVNGVNLGSRYTGGTIYYNNPLYLQGPKDKISALTAKLRTFSSSRRVLILVKAPDPNVQHLDYRPLLNSLVAVLTSPEESSTARLHASVLVLTYSDGDKEDVLNTLWNSDPGTSRPTDVIEYHSPPPNYGIHLPSDINVHSMVLRDGDVAISMQGWTAFKNDMCDHLRPQISLEQDMAKRIQRWFKSILPSVLDQRARAACFATAYVKMRALLIVRPRVRKLIYSIRARIWYDTFITQAEAEFNADLLHLVEVYRRTRLRLWVQGMLGQKVLARRAALQNFVGAYQRARSQMIVQGIISNYAIRRRVVAQAPVPNLLTGQLFDVFMFTRLYSFVYSQANKRIPNLAPLLLLPAYCFYYACFPQLAHGQFITDQSLLYMLSKSIESFRLLHNRVRNFLVLLAYNAGYVDGDGSIVFSLDKNYYTTAISCIALHQKSGFRRLLAQFLVANSPLGYTFRKPNAKNDDSVGINLTNTIQSSYQILSLMRFLILKRVVACWYFCSIGDTSMYGRGTRIKEFNHLVRRLIATVVSFTNDNHGNSIPWETFYNMLVEMYNRDREETAAYLAGMYDADGLIWIRLEERFIGLTQSCLPYMLAVQKFLHEVLGIQSRLYVKRRNEAHWHQNCVLKITVPQSRKIFLDRIAIYGMSRRVQWLAMYVATICELQKLPDRFVVIAFLSDFLKWVKWWFEES